MMNHSSLASLLLGLASLAVSGQVIGETKITQAADKSVSVATSVYTARIDAGGNLVELNVKGAPFATQNFVKPPDATSKTPTPFENVVINVTNQMVAVRSGDARTEWTFGEDSIDVATEGFTFEFQIDPTAKMALVKDTGAALLNSEKKFGGGHVIGVILDNDLSVMASANGKPYGFHIQVSRMFPNFYNNGFGKVGDKTSFTLKLGAPSDAVQFLSEVRLKAVGDSMDVLNMGGNQGKGIVHFAKEVPIHFETAQSNRGSTETMTLEYRCEVSDHYIWIIPSLAGAVAKPGLAESHRIFEQKRTVKIAPGAEAVEKWEIPAQKPGFYYLIISVWREGRKITETECLPFIVDLPTYAPKTTLPPDSDAFWAAREKSLKDTPFNPQLKRLTPEGSKAQLFEVTGDMPDGKKFLGLLEIPEGWDGKQTLLTATIRSGYDAVLKAVADGKWESKAKLMTLSSIASLDATYARWDSATDNNLLDNVMQWLRGVDYLKTRPDVKPGSIRLFGASRGGPLVLMTAAMRSGDILGASAHVHTSCGISWTDKPYYGWGLPGGHNSKDEQKVENLAAMSAYVDPVNYADRITCPITFGYGISDFGLSPPEGIEAAYVLTKSKWKRISRDAGGHQYSDGMKQINKDLDELLGSQQGEGDQQRILKEH